MNKFERFLGRISTKTCLKMDYFTSKSQKIVKLLSLKVLVDAYNGQILGQNETYILYFLPTCSKNVLAPLA